jgi:hypothetical protein
MIQVDERDLQIIMDLATRAPKTSGEQYAYEVIGARWNAEIEQNKRQKAEKAKAERQANTVSAPEDRIAG